jgi:2-C-methyl-D-erythritol 4-phosphate cytidylyltransferase/2-C-methyl-D-erythritol 2,4-cyclodiphosphate synthase
MRISAILVAAGAGTRAGDGPAKQWRPLAGKPVVRWAAEGLLRSGLDLLIVVTPTGEGARAAAALAGLTGWRTVDGGATRTDSVRAGLAALANDPPDVVLIHDSARPLVEPGHVRLLLEGLSDADGACPALPVADTLKRAVGGRVQATVSRDGLWRVQTPQAFRFDRLTAAYAALAADAAPTDDAGVVEAAGGRMVLTPGDPRLEKLTHAEDFIVAEALANAARITVAGQGFDVHAFGPGDRLWLCGVEIPHDRGLVGHSDADAGLHALCDAMLGAIAEGDIGDHFPPTDPRWRGAASHQFVTHALSLVRERGGRVLHADVTLISERPKVKPHREAMRARVAELLELPTERVSVKATTTERLGFTGREEGLAAQAVVSVELPA